MMINFEMGKVTKNTIRFEEILGSDLDAPKIGCIYIPKTTLADMGWKEGQKIVMEVSAK